MLSRCNAYCSGSAEGAVVVRWLIEEQFELVGVLGHPATPRRFRQMSARQLPHCPCAHLHLSMLIMTQVSKCSCCCNRITDVSCGLQGKAVENGKIVFVYVLLGCGGGKNYVWQLF